MAIRASSIDYVTETANRSSCANTEAQQLRCNISYPSYVREVDVAPTQLDSKRKTARQEGGREGGGGVEGKRLSILSVYDDTPARQSLIAFKLIY